MKRLFFVMAVFTATSLFTLSAQPQTAQKGEKPSREEMVEKKQEKVAKELGLSESQAKKLEEINKNYKEEQKASMEKFKNDRKASSDAHMLAIVELLDDEQLARLLAMKEHRPNRRGAKMGQQGRKGSSPQMTPRGGAQEGEGRPNRPMPPRGFQPEGAPQPAQ